MEINQKRIEKRIQFKDEMGIMAKIKETFQPIQYSDDQFTLNLLFDTPDFDLDNRYKIKARRYQDDLTIPTINPSDRYLLDFKYDENDTSKKERTEGQLEEHITYVQEKLHTTNVEPRAGFVYQRDHFISEQYPETRITVDSMVIFFRIDEMQSTVLQTLPNRIFEFKYAENNSAFEAFVNKLIAQFGGSKSLSKKERTQQLAKT